MSVEILPALFKALTEGHFKGRVSPRLRLEVGPIATPRSFLGVFYPAKQLVVIDEEKIRRSGGSVTDCLLHEMAHAASSELHQASHSRVQHGATWRREYMGARLALNMLEKRRARHERERAGLPPEPRKEWSTMQPKTTTDGTTIALRHTARPVEIRRPGDPTPQQMMRAIDLWVAKHPATASMKGIKYQVDRDLRVIPVFEDTDGLSVREAARRMRRHQGRS